MSNEAPNKNPFSVGQLLKGFALGAFLGVLGLGLDVFLGMVLVETHFMFLNAVATLGLLLLIAWLTVKKSRDTGFARGVLIALSIAAMVATTCAVVMGTGPFRFN